MLQQKIQEEHLKKREQVKSNVLPTKLVFDWMLTMTGIG